MCGIVGYIGQRDCTDVLMQGLEKLEYRGYDSAGIAVFEKTGIKTVKTKGKLAEMRHKLDIEGSPVGHCGIGHTRWATHGEPSDINSHPHTNGRVTIVHNGIIENYIELKEFLTEKGYTFTSQTDTEVVACLLDYYYSERNPLRAITETLKELKGSYALGIIFRDFPDRVYATRKESPLIVGIGENEYFIGSDIPAFLKYTKKYVLLDDNDIVCMKTDGIEYYDVHGIPEQKEISIAEWDVEQAQKCGYPHFMLKEIHEQPGIVAKTMESCCRDGVPYFENIGLTDDMLRDVKRVFIVACGTAMHAGIIARYAIEQLARVPVTVEVASEFRYMDPIVGEGDLVIVVSQSGETADTKAGLELAKERGAKTLAVVNVKYSAIARQADIYIHQADANGAGSTLFPLAGEVDDLKLYDEGDVIRLGDHEIQVLHTPGHSPGSVTLKVEDVLFTGDTLFCGSCGRTDLRGGSYEEIMSSLNRLGQLEGDFHVCPGHDRTSTLERERQYNPFLREAMAH